MTSLRSKGNEHSYRLQYVREKLAEGIFLELSDLAFLLSQEDPEVRQEVGLQAGRVKERFYGKGIKLFCPLYLSNDCLNNCLYCGFRRENFSAQRRTLTVDEAVNEARILAQRGFRRISLVAAENPRKVSIRYLRELIGTITHETGIRNISLNIAPVKKEEFASLREVGATAYQCFQETYQPFVYSFVHYWSGRKRDYLGRFGAPECAIQAGFTQVGMGVLLGLCDFRFDVLALIFHARSLWDRFPNVEVIVSLPRFRAAPGALLPRAPLPVSDEEFGYAVAICRLALPQAEIVISTREPPEIRDALMMRGASMMSAGSVTCPGGYSSPLGEPTNGQFNLEDTRSVEQVHAALVAQGLMPVY